jgi:hypothetical protein
MLFRVPVLDVVLDTAVLFAIVVVVDFPYNSMHVALVLCQSDD